MAGDSLADREWQHRGWMTAEWAAPAVVRLGRGRRRRVDEVTGFQMQRCRPGRSSRGCRTGAHAAVWLDA